MMQPAVYSCPLPGRLTLAACKSNQKRAREGENAKAGSHAYLRGFGYGICLDCPGLPSAGRLVDLQPLQHPTPTGTKRRQHKRKTVTMGRKKTAPKENTPPPPDGYTSRQIADRIGRAKTNGISSELKRLGIKPIGVVPAAVTGGMARNVYPKAPVDAWLAKREPRSRQGSAPAPARAMPDVAARIAAKIDEFKAQEEKLLERKNALDAELREIASNVRALKETQRILGEGTA